MTKSKVVFFRCDATPHIGTGHVVRCLALADFLKGQGFKVEFITDPVSPTIVPALRAYACHASDFKPSDCDWIIIDHYGLDAVYESTWRGIAGHIMVIDDLADRPHDCDVLLDQTFGRDPRDYRRLVPEGCLVLAGSQYALLRPEFLLWREEALKKRSLGVTAGGILLFISGSDPHNVTALVLRDLKEHMTTGHIDVVIGALNPQEQYIRTLLSEFRCSARLHASLTGAEMAQLLLTAEIAIGAGGTACWERCALGLPTIIIEIADNQRAIAAALDKAGAARNMGRFEQLRKGAVSDTLREIMALPGVYRSMSEKAFSVCDAKGAERVVNHLKSVGK